MSEPEAAMMLGQKVSDAFARLAFYQAWLDLVSPPAAAAFAAFVRRTDEQWQAHCEHAWQQPPPGDDAGFQVSEWQPYRFDNQKEQALCLRIMRRELKLLAPLYRRASRAELAAA